MDGAVAVERKSRRGRRRRRKTTYQTKLLDFFFLLCGRAKTSPSHFAQRPGIDPEVKAPVAAVPKAEGGLSLSEETQTATDLA